MSGAGGNPRQSNNNKQEQPQWQPGYILRRTEQAQQASTNPKDRIHTNPFLQIGGAHASSTTTTPTTTIEQRGQYTPNRQLESPRGETDNTPSKTLSWGKAELRTPLNKMARGTSSNWTETPDKVQVKIPRSQPFPKERVDEWRMKFNKLHPIPEENENKRNNRIQGPSIPTTSMLDMAERITSIPYTTLKLDDITTPNSSEGTTVAVAILMEIIKGHMLPMGSEAQMHNLAHFLMATSTESLLHYLRDGDALGEFVHNRINRTDNVLPPFDESKLHPYKTRSLVNDQDIWGRMDERWTKAEYASVILPFVQRFYPTETAKVKAAIYSGELDIHMRDIIMVPGYFTSYWHPQGGPTTYAPPIWVDLHVAEKEQHPPSGSAIGSFDDDECPDMLDGFTPMNHMGIPPKDIMQMTPANQKIQALSALPHILKQLISIESAADIMIKLAQTPEHEFPACLQTEGFQRCLQEPKQGMEQPGGDHPTYRIRMRVRQERGRAPSNIGEVAHNWLLAVHTLVTALNISMKITSPPYAKPNKDIIINDGVPEMAVLENYVVKLRQSVDTGAFDIWCITTCSAWGRHRFKYDRTDAAKTYYEELVTQRIMVSDEESYPAELKPCVALVGSTNRDRDDLIQAEYGTQMKLAQLESIPFKVIWCSLRNKDNRSVMIKCIATTEEHTEEVTTLFTKIRQATITAFYPVTYLFTITPIPQTQGSKHMQEITEIIMSQRSREEDTIWVALTGLNNTDPFTFYPREREGHQSRYTLAEKILTGWEQDSDMYENMTPVRNLTTDEAFSRCYLLAPKEDAAVLIQYAKRIAPLFAGWVGNTTEVRVLSGVAEKWVQKDTKEPPTKEVSAKTTSTTSALTTSTNTIDTKINERFDQIKCLLEEQGQQLQQLQQMVNSNTGHPTETSTQDIVRTITDTMTTAITTIREDMVSHHSKQTQDIAGQIEGLSVSIGNTITSTHASQRETSDILMELVERYNHSIENVNDSNLAYGNEIAVLRLVMDACTHRVNWLVEDIGSTRADKPPPPTEPKLSTRGMETILQATHEVYEEGGTRVDLGTALADRCIQLTQDQDGTSGTQVGDGDLLTEEVGEGRQREPPIQPPMATRPPGTTPPTPPLPDDTAHTIKETERNSNATAMEPTSGNGNKHRTMGTTGAMATTNAQRTDEMQNDSGEVMISTTVTTGWGTCTCCDKTSDILRTCDTCGMLFHDDCIEHEAKSDIWTCTQCEVDQQMNNSTTGSDISTSSSSSENTRGSSYSRQSPKRKSKSKIPKPRKHSKTVTHSQLSARPKIDEEEPLLTQPSPTIISTTTTETPKQKKKSTQSTLTQRPDTGTIQLETIADRLRKRPPPDNKKSTSRSK